ncbi:hypothetical protein TNCV_1962371 [Trichonephila clavipes]|nr:hypothetical protein TNCV_1962371 [Trichonephila clavipes]
MANAEQIKRIGQDVKNILQYMGVSPSCSSLPSIQHFPGNKNIVQQQQQQKSRHLRKQKLANDTHSFEHTTVDSTIWLGSTSVQLTTSPCHKGSIHLQTSMPSPGFEPRPYVIAVSVTNLYTGWAARIKQYNKN